MPEYFITSQAEADLAELLLYISDDDPDAAFAFENRLLHVFDLLAENPFAGRERAELVQGARSFAVGRYLIVYRLWAGEVAIVRVVYGSRDLDEILGEGE